MDSIHHDEPSAKGQQTALGVALLAGILALSDSRRRSPLSLLDDAIDLIAASAEKVDLLRVLEGESELVALLDSNRDEELRLKAAEARDNWIPVAEVLGPLKPWMVRRFQSLLSAVQPEALRKFKAAGYSTRARNGKRWIKTLLGFSTPDTFLEKLEAQWPGKKRDSVFRLGPEPKNPTARRTSLLRRRVLKGTIRESAVLSLLVTQIRVTNEKTSKARGKLDQARSTSDSIPLIQAKK